MATCWVPFTNSCAWAPDDKKVAPGDKKNSVLAPYCAVDFTIGEEKSYMEPRPVELKLGRMGEASGLASTALRLVAFGGGEGNGILAMQALTDTKRLKKGDVLLWKEM